MLELINKKIRTTKEQDKQNIDIQFLQKKIILNK